MMDIRRARFILVAAVLLLAGCRPKPPADNASSAPPPGHRPAPPPLLPTIARGQWLGMKRLSAETNAAHLRAVWNLPESKKLEQQTLDKLALAPWSWLRRGVDTNAAALLRPLLDDVVEAESGLEIRQAPHQPGELAFAIRLDGRRAALWQTNLARVLESLTGIHPVPAPDHQYGWSLKKHHAPDFIELTRAGEWTIVGAAQDHNDLVAELKSRIQRDRMPLRAEDTNDWFTMDLDLLRAGGALTLDWDLPRDLPRISLAVTGDGTNVLLHGTADFPGPLVLDLKPWNIPTNLIDQQLSSFTLIRGIQPCLASSAVWTNLHIGLPPDQLCFWAQQGLPAQSYFAAPLPDASNEVDRLADWVMHNQYRWYPTNGLAAFTRSKAFNGLQWKGLPYMSPFLCSPTINHENFVYGGAFPNSQVRPLSLKTLQTTLSRTNLVYHDWEITGLRIDQWLYMDQFARLVSNKAQLPAGSPGLLWLKAIEPKLEVSLTDVTQTGPRRLSFDRKSTLGLTAIELNVLADWLESPQFPYGLHTFMAPPPPE